MKSLLLAVLFIGLFSFVEAQQDLKSKYFIGGSLGFSQDNTTNSGIYKTTSTNLSPTIGYFFSSKFACGLQADYSYNSANYSTGKSQVYGIAPFLRYFKNLTDKFAFYTDLAVPYSYSTNTINGINILLKPNTENSIGVTITPGIQWFIKDNLSLIGSLGVLGYNYSKTKDSGSTITENNLNLSLSTNISLGLNFYFGGIRKQE